MAIIYQDWKYRADLAVTNPSSTDGVQASFSLSWLPGMRKDFRDIRFADKNGNALSYWIESKTDFTSAIVWVKLPANDKKIRLYYGNGAVVSESDGTAIFDTFFDFADGTYTGWTVLSGTWSAAAGHLTASTQNNYIHIPSQVDPSKNLHWGFDTTYKGTHNQFYLMGTNDTGYNYAWTISIYTDDIKLGKRTTSTTDIITSGISPVIDTTYHIDVYRTSAGVWKLYVNGTLYGTETDTYLPTYKYTKIRSSWDAACNYYDNIFLREYPTTEPTLAFSRKQPNPDYFPLGFLASTDVDQITFPGASITISPGALLLNGADIMEGVEFDGNITVTAGTPALVEKIPLSGSLTITAGEPILKELITCPDAGITITAGSPDIADDIESAASITITAGVPQLRKFVDLNAYDLVSVDISRSISDSMWQLSAKIAGSTAPDDFTDLHWEATDASGNTQHLFTGIIPRVDRSFRLAANELSVIAYDYGWYLSAQKVPLDMLVMDLDGSRNTWDDWVEDLLDDTGIVAEKINTCSVASKQFTFSPTTSKLKAIQDICDYTGFVFYVKPVTDGTVWRAGAYFVDESDIDDSEDGLDLPAAMTITWPDSSLVAIPKVTSAKAEERINRVTVRGNSGSTWYTSTVESAAVTAGEEYPREYYEESSDWDSQAKCDARAQKLYNYYNTGSATVEATFIKRFDLELYQLISFSGAGFDSSLTTLPDLRIISIRYSQSAEQDLVTITAMPDRNMDLQTGTAADDGITTVESIVDYELAQVEQPCVGTVQSIDGPTATILTEDGKTIIARVIS